MLAEVGEKNNRVVALSADSSSGSGMSLFHQRFPERHFEFGIMEQGIVGIALQPKAGNIGDHGYNQGTQ